MTIPPEEPDYNVYVAGRAFDPLAARPKEETGDAAYYIVQFTRPLERREREHMQRRYGLLLDSYIPNFAFLERMAPETLEALSQESFHRAVTPYLPELKISPHIGTHKFKTPARKNLKGFLLRAIPFPAADPEAALEHLDRLLEDLALAGVERVPLPSPPSPKRRRGSRARTEEEAADEDAVARPEVEYVRLIDDRDLKGQAQIIFVLPSAELLLPIAELDWVRWIEEVAEADTDCPSAPNLVAGTLQSGEPGIVPVWQNNINGRGQTIGVIDHALVNTDHCMFRDSANPIGPDHRKVAGFRFFRGAIDRHAARVAGIAAGDVLGQPGANDSRGIAFAARLSLDDRSFITSSTQSLLRLLGNAAGEEAKIHSNSWHDRTSTYNQTSHEADNFVWLNEENFICGSAGNLDEELGPPGTAKNALCVGASRAHPNHQEFGDGVEGPTPDGRRKPEIYAPGCGIVTARRTNNCLCDEIMSCASSWATPVIAGAAALVRQYYTDGFHPTGTPVAAHRRPHVSAALVKATLLNSTAPMIPVNDYPNDVTGWGVAVLSNTLFFAGGPRKLFIHDLPNAQGFGGAGEFHDHSLVVSGSGQTLKVTLVWSDAPASALTGTGKALVNDLDLIVASPNGLTFRGNVNIVGGNSQPAASGRDENNNVEMVIVDAPQPGTWTLTVRCAAANVGTQGYALVASGDLL